MSIAAKSPRAINCCLIVLLRAAGRFPGRDESGRRDMGSQYLEREGHRFPIRKGYSLAPSHAAQSHSTAEDHMISGTQMLTCLGTALAACVSLLAQPAATASKPADQSMIRRLGYPEGSKLLIVHGDDFGEWHGVNT